MTLTFNKPLILGKKEVYNPDAFTSSGTVSITDEGIFTLPNGTGGILNTGVNVSDAPDNFEIECGYTALGAIPNQRWYWVSSAPEEGIISMQLASNGYCCAIFHLKKQDNTKTDIRPAVYNVPRDTGTKYNFIMGRKNGGCYLKVYVNGVLFGEETLTTELPMYNSNASITIGQYHSTYNRPFLGAIDLKKVKIRKNAIEVFSGSKLIKPEWQNKPFEFNVNTIN